MLGAMGTAESVRLVFVIKCMGKCGRKSLLARLNFMASSPGPSVMYVAEDVWSFWRFQLQSSQ